MKNFHTEMIALLWIAQVITVQQLRRPKPIQRLYQILDLFAFPLVVAGFALATLLLS